MFELISLRNPQFFIPWWLTYCVFYFIINKTIHKYKHLQYTLSSSAMALIYLFAKFFDEVPLLLAIGVCAVIVAVMLIIKKKTIFRTLSYTLIPHLLIFLSGTLIGIVQILIFGNSYVEYYAHLETHQDYMGNLIYSILFNTTNALFFSGLIKLVLRKTKKDFNFSPKYLFFLWFPITHVATFLMFYILLLKLHTQFLSLSIAVGCLMGLIMVLDIVSFFVVERFEKVERENKKYQEELFKYQLDYQQTLLLRENQKEIRKMRHDMLNILSTADGFIDIQKYDKASSILKNATNDLSSLKGVSICSNETLNTILSIKMNHATEKDITLNFNITENSPISIDDYSLCRIIGNLTDNAINAVKETDSDTVNITIEIAPEALTIITENKFDAKEDKAITKNKNRGQGKGIIRDIVKKFDGSYNCAIDGELYKTTTVLSNVKTDI